MATNDPPPPIAIPKHHRIASRPRYCLAVSDIGKRVVPRANANITVNPIVLLAERDSRVRSLGRILEVVGDSRRSCGDGLRRGSPKKSVGIVLGGYPRRITTVVCGAPSRRGSRNLIVSARFSEPRILPLSPELATLIERRWSAREYKAADGTPGISARVFHRRGQPLGDFRKSWAAACEAAGVSGALFHDVRR